MTQMHFPANREIEMVLLALQLFQVLFLWIHDWIPLGRLNDVEAVRSQDTTRRLVTVTLIQSVPWTIGQSLQPREQVGSETFRIPHERRRFLPGPEELLKHELRSIALEVFGFRCHAEWSRRYVDREHEFSVLGRVVEEDSSQRLQCLALLIE